MDTLKEIYQKLIDLWHSHLEIFQVIKDWKQKISSFLEFWDKFFSLVPWEVILLLVCVSLIMVLLNNISPTTPRINLTIGVVVFGVVYTYVVYILTNQWKILRIVYISSFVLVPTYFVEIFLLFKKLYLRSTFKNLTLNSSYLKDSLQSIHREYAEFVSSQTLLNEEPEKFILALKKLENSISNLRTTLEKQKISKIS